jgi:hypothetical protein
VSRFPAAFPLPAFASWSSFARRGVGRPSRSAYRPKAGPRRGFRVPHARATIGVGALSTPGTTVLILTGVAHRPAPVASQRHVPTPRHTTSIDAGLCFTKHQSRVQVLHPSDLPLAGRSRMEQEPLGLEPRASHPALTGDARRGGDRSSSTDLKHPLRHRPSLQSCVFTQCVRPRVARDEQERRRCGSEVLGLAVIWVAAG